MCIREDGLINNFFKKEVNFSYYGSRRYLQLYMQLFGPAGSGDLPVLSVRSGP